MSTFKYLLPERRWYKQGVEKTTTYDRALLTALMNHTGERDPETKRLVTLSGLVHTLIVDADPKSELRASVLKQYNQIDQQIKEEREREQKEGIEQDMQTL